MEATVSKTQIATILTLSLSIHFMFLFSLTSNIIMLQQKNNPFKQEEHQDQEREDWVAMNGYGLGAPVLFADQEYQTDIPADTEPTSFKNHAQNMISDEKQSGGSDHEQNTPTVHAAQATTKPELIHSSATKTTQLKTKEDIPSVPTPRKPTVHDSSNSLTFTKLATGFMQYMKNPAHIPSGITVASNKKGVPSDKQIARMNFEQKLLKCIVNSYQIHRLEAPQRLQRQRAAVALALNRDGTIYGLELIHSSGVQEIDRFILTFFKDTQHSFPPIPQQFTAPYHLPVIAFDDVRLFQSPQYWYYASNQ